MKVNRYHWHAEDGWTESLPLDPDLGPQLILSFGPLNAPPGAWFDDIRTRWPGAEHVYCSGGGQISDGTVHDDQTVVTAIQFETARVHTARRSNVSVSSSTAVGADLGRTMAEVPGLRHVLIFAEGLTLNAAAFIAAMNDTLPAHVSVTGGLASDGTDLARTVVGLNASPTSGNVVAVGLAGESLSIGTGSAGGWDLFGPERIVTRGEHAVVHELDGEPALDVYKRYLGSFADELPGAALLFPLAVWQSADGPVAVRTILAVDEALGTLRFAGDIPQGSTVRLMRATTDKLVEGAAQAARIARGDASRPQPQLTLCVSCIGRRAVMRSRVEEELDEVTRTAENTPVVGFYSNGEIAPPTDGRAHARAVLHNQTMTVTSIGER